MLDRLSVELGAAFPGGPVGRCPECACRALYVDRVNLVGCHCGEGCGYTCHPDALLRMRGQA